MNGKIIEIHQCKCGSEDLHIETLEYRTWFYVYCHGCGANGPAINDKLEAVRIWNKVVANDA